MSASEVLHATYRIELRGKRTEVYGVTMLRPRRMGFSEHYLRELEENVNKLLPEGYRVVIRPEEPS